MPAFPRAELEEMIERWLAANKACEAAGDWKALADHYTEDATYGWNMGPKEDFMAVGREEIRDIALGLEMGGLDGWQYPYQDFIVDDQRGYVLGLWKQVADEPRKDGSTYEIGGIGGSWFRYAGDWKWDWQRDFFDFGNATSLFIEMIQDGVLSDGMKRRMQRAATPDRLPGHYEIGKAPAPLWP